MSDRIRTEPAVGTVVKPPQTANGTVVKPPESLNGTVVNPPKPAIGTDPEPPQYLANIPHTFYQPPPPHSTTARGSCRAPMLP
jgi:hypothetical protein